MKKGLLFLSVVLCLILSTTAVMAAPPSINIAGPWDFYARVFCYDGNYDTVILTDDVSIYTGFGYPGYLIFDGNATNFGAITGVLVDTYEFTAVVGGDMILEGQVDRKGEVINFKIIDIDNGDGAQCSGYGSLTKPVQ